jgi:hypothetical protein
MKRLCWLATAFALFLTAGCGKEWKEASSPEGKFTVLMPGTPKEQSRTQAGITNHIFALEVKDGAYMVSYLDVPPGTPANYSLAIQAAAANRQGKGVKESDITIEGHEGKAYEFEMGNPKGYAVGRIVLVNNRLYQLLVMGANISSSDADVQKFLNSFKLTK